MSTRRYEQVCGVARSLDLLGERWTMLVVRELLLGPKRFGSLADALPGIGPNLLSARLAALGEAGLVHKVDLPPPAAASAYALTERGEGLREPVEALAVWGYDLLDPEREVAEGSIAAAAWTLAAAATRERRSTRPALTVNFNVDGDRFFVRTGPYRAVVRHGADEQADSEFSCDMDTFYELTQDRRGSDDPAVAAVLGAIAPIEPPAQP